MEEEDEICRVCRSEATPEQPLFHPCKCSGSIRYVHQECLIEWLSHSGKKYCELCEHPFTFTPVYRQDMPDVIPARLFFLQLLKKSTFALITASRAILVSFVWLIILPYFSIWIWRLYFLLSTSLSQHLSKLQALNHLIDNNNTTTAVNSTTVDTWLQDYKSEFSFKLFLSDCFKGQLIDCVVFIAFVAIFLLREWIIQNIPMEQQQQQQQPRPIHIPQPPAEEEEEAPPSPVAPMDDTFSFEQATTSTTWRAQSLPPVLPSYDFTLVEDDAEPHFRRAASVDVHPVPTNEYHAPFRMIEEEEEEDEEEDLPQPARFGNIFEEEAQPAQIAQLAQIAQDILDADEGEEEEEENIEEFEGILEAIGMQGSLWTLVQNSCLMGLLIALSLGAAVWMPYLIGMLFIITDIVELVRIPLTAIRYITDPILDFIFDIGPSPPQLEPTTSSLLTPLVQFMNETEPLVESAFQRYQALAVGQTAMDRGACIAVGYIVITILSCWYMTRAQHFATAALGRTAQEALRHQGIIFKVGMFITLELVVFPLVCGFLLDLSTMPLFKTGFIRTTREHPLASLFLHWFLGTSFMFTFAVVVTVCRDVVRPGVMWFIRDPNDPEFHPIRDIVERPIGYQFRKILTSALIYMMVIVVGVGGVVHLVDRYFDGFLPLKWSLSNSLSVLPIDLVVMQVGLPALVKYTRPKQTMKRIFVKWVAVTCRQLRLTSFMLGGRHPQEEGRLVYRSWSAWLRRVKPSRYPEEGTIDNIVENEVTYLWEGQLLRVPRHDSVEVMPHRRMLVPLDNYTLEPLNMMERRLGHPASRGPGGDELNTVVVYSPPNFKQRLWFFIGFMWISVTVFFCAVTMVPIVLGRYLFKHVLVVDNDVHDMYSFVVGGSIMLGMDVVVTQLFASLDDIMGQPNDIMASVWRQAKQWGFWTVRWVFFVVVFGLLIPMTLGVLIELYFVMPLKQLGEETASMEVLSIWAHGFVCMNVIHGFIQIFPNNPARQVIENVFRGGVHQMKLELCIKKILIPLFVMSAVAIGFPFITAYINMKITALTNPEIRTKVVQIAYPTALVGLAGYYLIKLGARIGTRFAQNIREDNYLIGRTLHNLE